MKGDSVQWIYILYFLSHKILQVIGCTLYPVNSKVFL